MTLEFEVDVDYLTDGGINGMPMWVKLNDEGGEYISTVYVNSSSYWHVVDENTKLRELVSHLYECMCNVDVDGNHECDSCEYDNAEGRCDFVRQMRELGVKVDR